MPKTLKKLVPLHSQIVPPINAVPFGMTDDGKQLYKEVTPRSGSEPFISEETGKQEWRKNQMTGEPLYPLRRPTFYEHTRVYYLESQGNGNIGKVDWRPPSPEEVARAERNQQVEAMKDHLAEALVDAKVSPTELAEMFSKRAGAPAVPELPELVELDEEEEPVVAPPVEVAEPVDTDQYPKNLGGGWFELSDGAKLQGKEEQAIEAEIDLEVRRDEAHKVAEATPEI